jgi:hypothetical protein
MSILGHTQRTELVIKFLTIRQGPYQNEREEILLSRINEFPPTPREVSSRLCFAIDEVHSEGAENRRQREEDEPAPIFES